MAQLYKCEDLSSNAQNLPENSAWRRCVCNISTVEYEEGRLILQMTGHQCHRIKVYTRVSVCEYVCVSVYVCLCECI